MDGILVLIVIGWIIKAIVPKKKKTARKAAFQASKPRAQQPGHKIHPAFESQPRPDAQFAPSEGEGSIQQMWSGSLEVDSSEGEDLCDPALGHEREVKPMDAQSVYANAISSEPLLDPTPRALLQGVIMSEILTRPADRRRR